MEVQWFGQNCFLLKGTSVSLLIDPYKDVLKKLPQEIDLVIRTGEETDYDDSGLKYAHLFDWPGDYEAKGVAISLSSLSEFSSEHLLADIFLDGFRIANLGALNQELSGQTAETLGDIDVLMVPVGGEDVLNAKKANSVIEMLEPKTVILSFADENKISEFAKEAGVTLNQEHSKLKLKSPDQLPVDTTDFFALQMS